MLGTYMHLDAQAVQDLLAGGVPEAHLAIVDKFTAVYSRNWGPLSALSRGFERYRQMMLRQQRETARMARKQAREAARRRIFEEVLSRGQTDTLPDGLWHPAANKYFDSLSRFRAETAARGYQEVGDFYERHDVRKLARPDLEATAEEKEVVREVAQAAVREIVQNNGTVIVR